MRFRHADALWQEFPALVPGVVYADGVGPEADVAGPVARYTDLARTRLAGGTESELPEIRAWRRTFGQLGLKPTQYRCASESLLRRLRKEGELPSIHPVIDLCNAISLAFAVPVAVFDVAEVAGSLEVRRATGEESYLTFAGQTEHPEPGEVIFADEAGRAHARRWTNRQSGRSAVRDTTTRVLVVAEGLHETAPDDVARLVAAVAEELAAGWQLEPRTALPTRATPELAV